MLKPKPTPTRELVNLDGVWKFGIDTRLGDEPWSGPLQTPLEAAVPASYNDLFTDPEIRDHVGWVYYQREVRVPRGWANERVLLRFDAATHAARVYVGDQLVGKHVGGYTPFDIDITDLAPAGSAFRLTVAVSGDLTNETIPPGKIEVGFDGKRKQTYFHDFYNYAGLARSVSLHSVPVRSISDVTVRTTFEDKVGAVDYRVDAADGLEVRVRLADASGAVVATADGATGVLSVEDVTLWQPGAAYLYELTVEALDGGEIVDSYPVPVGVRTVEVRGAQFLVNGEPFYFTGFGKHEDTTVRGKGHDNAYLVHDFQLLEWTGANSFRTSHYPYAEEVLEFADRHGILVIDETAAVGLNMGVVGGMTGTPPFPTFSEQYANERTQAAHEQHLRELITRDKNHPSVVMWSIANEPASNEDGAREYFEPLVNLVREMDPTRPITYSLVMFATFNNDQIIDLFDVVSINRYYGWYVTAGDLASAELMLEGDLRGWIERTGKPIMMSEYGADTQEGLHSVWDQVWTEEYQASFLAMYHRVFDRLPEFVGEQVWNFADFATTNGLHRVGGNRKGVFTRDRKPKAAAHELRRRWRGLDGRKPSSDD
ncbi:beta-glucuronidase [Pseudoclavibacter sp. RFBJ3]|uniref:beta-glucuronidase n=1 Tax=unclassified Pseudoclavibacter TaxID=2615177 RepID=UPI000CE8BE7A|nr:MULTISPECIES: beta-glucuronidase [unclassified Pseudoclavibacter]PPF80601.1 beta-glucuronidase [Pseudoclavibacter sp. RFBJ5]PPF90254.1 beta-glucuronidase [Pseudoclavibacter sp. RFBJ3]PPF94933.1 beta-glucuronidase [Pseudoclavibacter sp. RFBH5]PPG19060.1 beta-glucuronidase [Pseudoclavibacter sp. RFBI4]